MAARNKEKSINGKPFDLVAQMESLYTTLDYYISLPPRTIKNPNTYWSQATDPDGQTRNRLNESRCYLTNLSEELNFIRALRPGKMLDIGCGPGWLLSAIDPLWDKHGIEPSREAAAIAAKHAKIYSELFEEVDLQNQRFELVVMYHVVEHMKDPIRALQSEFNMLATGGHLILGTPDFDSGAARRDGTNYRLLHDPSHISLFSNDSMHRLLRDLGFQIQKVSYPFFDTSYFTDETLLRLLRPDGISPPFYGNFMTFYCTI